MSPEPLLIAGEEHRQATKGWQRRDRDEVQQPAPLPPVAAEKPGFSLAVRLFF